MTMKVTLIAAACRQWGIGKRNGLPWRHSDDLKHFRSRTMGKYLLVGRKTKDTLPILPGRNVSSISSSNGDFSSIEEALSHFEKIGVDELIIAGGGQLYESILHLCTTAEISRIEGDFECDAFMPNLNHHDGWKLTRIDKKTPNLKIEYWINECIK